MTQGKRHVVGAVLCAGMMSLVPAATARANDWDQKTFVTFRNPIELPGVALAPGTYRFEVPDGNDRQLVRVMNRTGTRVYGTFMTQPVSRLEPTGTTSITFKERGRNAPFPIRTWFYAGERDGHLFIYKQAASRTSRAPAPSARRPVRRPAHKKGV